MCILAIMLPVCLFAVEDGQKISDIDKLISLLRQQAYDFRLKAYELEIDAQQSFFVNWEEYSEKIEQSEKLKNKAVDLEKNMTKLETDKNKILNHK